MPIFSCPVIGQGARDEIIAAFTTNETVFQLMSLLSNFYTHKSPATFLLILVDFHAFTPCFIFNTSRFIKSFCSIHDLLPHTQYTYIYL